MEHTRRRSSSGACPARQAVLLCSLSLALLVLDARFQYGEGVRALLGSSRTRCNGSPPRRSICCRASAATSRYAGAADRGEPSSSARRRSPTSQRRATLQAAEAEAAQLRRLIGAAERLTGRTPAGRSAVRRARPVLAQGVHRPRRDARRAARAARWLDETGVVGQVTRVHPLVSEVTLITDRDQAIPVQVRAQRPARGRLRRRPCRRCSSCASWPAIAEIQKGDRLVTSRHRRHLSAGPAGRRRGASVERDAGAGLRARHLPAASAGVDARPLRAGARRATQIPPGRGPRKPSSARTAARRRRAAARSSEKAADESR